MKLFKKTMQAFYNIIPRCDPRKVLHGVEVVRQGDKVRLTATNGRVLVRATVPASQHDRDGIIPESLWKIAMANVASKKTSHKIWKGNNRVWVDDPIPEVVVGPKMSAFKDSVSKRVIAEPNIIGTYPKCDLVIPAYEIIEPEPRESKRAAHITVDTRWLLKTAQALNDLVPSLNEGTGNYMATKHRAIDMIVPINAQGPIKFTSCHADREAIDMVAVLMPVKTEDCHES